MKGKVHIRKKGTDWSNGSQTYCGRTSVEGSVPYAEADRQNFSNIWYCQTCEKRAEADRSQN